MNEMIQNYIYFYHLDCYHVIPLYPELITDNMLSTFAQTNALSRSAPVFTYSYSGPRDVLITLDMHRDMMNDLKLGEGTFSAENGHDFVDVLVLLLLAAALPKYNAYNAQISGVVPPMVAVRFGNQLFIKGVITSGVSVTYKKPIMDDGKYACVSVTFTVSEVEPYDAEVVASAGSFRGLTAGNNFFASSNWS